MKLTRQPLLLAALLLCAALLVGCGGGLSKAEYEAEVKKIGNAVEDDIDSLDSGEPNPEDIETAQNSIEKAADDISELEPPTEVEKLHADLVSALRDTAKLLGRLGPLMEQANKDPQSMGEDEMAKMNEITADFGKIQERMNRVTEGYAKKDYDIGLGEGTGDDSRDADGDRP